MCSLRSRRYEESAWPVEKAQELDESILALRDELAQIAADTARAAAAAVKLEAEPMNRALGELVGAAEAESTALAEEVASRRGANADDGSADRAKRARSFYVAEWVSRKRKCVAALDTLESMSDGAISRAKVLNAEGPIEMEGDERAIKNAILAAKAKAKRPKLSSKKKLGAGTGLVGDPALVGVRLDPVKSNVVQRVYAE